MKRNVFKRILLLNLSIWVLSSSLITYAEESGEESSAITSTSAVTSAVSEETESKVDEIIETAIRDTIEESQTENSVSSSTTRWIPDDTRTTTMPFIMNTGEVKKFEIFYTASATEEPIVRFLTPEGLVLNAGSDTLAADLYFVTRKDYTVSNYPNIKYMNVYINPLLDNEAGEWTASFTIGEDVTEFVVLEAKADEGWEDFIEDYKSSPKEVKLWYIAQGSMLSVSDIKPICLRDNRIPESNNLSTYVEPPKEKKSIFPTVIVLIIIAIIGGVGGTVFLYKRILKANKEKREHEINIENKQIKRKKKKENENLSKFFTTYTDDYSDNNVDEDSHTVDYHIEEKEEHFVPTTDNTDTTPIKAEVRTKRRIIKNTTANKQKPANNKITGKNNKNQPVKTPKSVPQNNKPVNTQTKSSVGTNNLGQVAAQANVNAPVNNIPVQPQPVQQGTPVLMPGQTIINGQILTPVYIPINAGMPNMPNIGQIVNTPTNVPTPTPKEQMKKIKDEDGNPLWVNNKSKNITNDNAPKWQKSTKDTVKKNIF